MHSKSDLAQDLAGLLGDTVVVTFLAQGAHWNVRGPEFVQFHDFFESYYKSVRSMTDPLAEYLRVLQYPAPCRLEEFLELSAVEPRDAGSDPIALTAALHAANNVLIDRLDRLFACASDCNEQGVADFAAGRLDAHKKWRWQLGTTVGADSTSANQLAEPAGYVEYPDYPDYPSDVSAEDAIVMLASAHGVNPAVLRAAWRRAVSADEAPLPRVAELAQKKYESRDADLLPRR